MDGSCCRDLVSQRAVLAWPRCQTNHATARHAAPDVTRISSHVCFHPSGLTGNATATFTAANTAATPRTRSVITSLRTAQWCPIASHCVENRSADLARMPCGFVVVDERRTAAAVISRSQPRDHVLTPTARLEAE